MVKSVSIKEVLTNQSEKKDIKTISNDDFLKLLLKNLDIDEKSDTKKIEIKDEKSDEKDEVIEKTPLNNISKDNLELNTNIKIDEKTLNLTEIKNIIVSKLKQNNILLNKSDLKELKESKDIDSLIKFANKKGLNLKDIKLEIIQSKKIQNSDISTNKELIKTTTNIKENHKITSITNQIINNKSNTEMKPNIKIEAKEKEIVVVNLNSILKNSTHKKIDEKRISIIDNNEKNSTHKKIVTNKIKEVLVSKNSEIAINPKLNDNKTIIEKKELIKPITLDDLISTTKIKDNEKVKIKSEIKNDSIQINSGTVENEVKLKMLTAKETLKEFSSNLKQAVQEYKPPISKLSLELNPEKLGKMDVTLIKRGDTLKITLNSANPATMNMFHTNQAEFRANLASIGFTNIDMSFNSNSDRKDEKNREKYKQNQNSINQNDDSISEIEITASIKYA